MTINHYLKRLELSVNELEPNISNLDKLIKLHLKNIPFENLDIHYRNPIRLDKESLLDKILNQKRGGFCYELNGLFYYFLKHLGYNVNLISAQVFGDDDQYSPEFDHAAILVKMLDNVYLIDVGFGDFTDKSLNLKEDNLQINGGKFYGVRKEKDFIIIYSTENDISRPIYKFLKTSRQLSDFEERSQYHQTNQASHFHKKKIISKLTDKGRITLTDDALTIFECGNKSKIKIETGEFSYYLKHYFQITTV